MIHFHKQVCQLVFFLLYLNPGYNEAQVKADSLCYTSKIYQLANHDVTRRWPVKINLPQPGAILPFKRIVAYYGNFYSPQMGVLGEYPPEQMIEKLKAQIKEWQKADTSTPVLPAIQYIAVTAQQDAGEDHCYRLRMPFTEIDKAIQIADKINGIVFLDIQVGLSNLQEELPLLVRYLSMPQVHLAIDPEYSMKTGQPPGTLIGFFDAADVNYAVTYLAALVHTYHLSPKILVVHRFTKPMLTNFKKIMTNPAVQVVINMDGFGSIAKKKNSYYQVIFKEPVEFTGIKLFYKQDEVLMAASDVLQLTPIPIYIQYQ